MQKAAKGVGTASTLRVLVFQFKNFADLRASLSLLGQVEKRRVGGVAVGPGGRIQGGQATLARHPVTVYESLQDGNLYRNIRHVCKTRN